MPRPPNTVALSLEPSTHLGIFGIPDVLYVELEPGEQLPGLLYSRLGDITAKHLALGVETAVYLERYMPSPTSCLQQRFPG